MYTAVPKEHFEQMATCDACPIDNLDVEDAKRRGDIMLAVMVVKASSDVEILPGDSTFRQMKKLGLRRRDHGENIFQLSDDEAQTVIACGLCRAAGDCALKGTEK